VSTPPQGHSDRPDFSRIRHELRTPVNHIIGYSEMLLEDESTAAEFREDLQRIHSGGRRLLALIKEYFDEEFFSQKRPDLHQLHHELRTPVNHIVGYTELLEDQARERGAGALASDLGKIREAAHAWLGLIERYLIPRPVGDSPREPAAPAAAPGPAAAWDLPAAQPAAPAHTLRGTLLVVDDDPANRDMLSRRLERMGHTVAVAASGLEALQLVRTREFDVVLLDLVMPELDGYQVLTRIKSDPSLAEIRVIILSALDQESSIARCIEAGADDYLAKPFNPIFLKARLGACLEKKHLRDRERQYLGEIEAEREKAERLLLNILPRSIAARLKQGEQMIADSFAETTVLFADLVGFTSLSRSVPPGELIDLLNDIFSRFDEMASELGLEKIKTIGDAYMVVAGVPEPRPDHAAAAAELALRMHRAILEISRRRAVAVNLRIGLHSGPVIAGIIGRSKFSYDLWGDTVNTASRMESTAPVGATHVSNATAALLGPDWHLEPRGKSQIKGLGAMETWLLGGGRTPPPA
jgi:class 3 adenylate cyclase/ActR/RegA family two-component response regulator